MTIRVAIVEDHEVVADALSTMLSFDEDIQVVGFVGSCAEALSLVRDKKPDVVLMDISLAGDADGVEATRQLVEADASVAVLMFTMHDDADSVARAIAAGARGYIPKNTARAELLTALRTVANGDGYLHPTVTRPVLDRIGAAGVGPDGGQSLTRQEQRVLQRLADGNSTRQIANLLSISDETVKTHLTHIYQKLGVTDRTQAVATALRQGLVS